MALSSGPWSDGRTHPALSGAHVAESGGAGFKRQPQRVQQIAHCHFTEARQLLESSESAEVFYEAMLRLHPNRLNPGALWGAAITLLGARLRQAP